MAIGETPSEPLIALMNHALDGGPALSHKKEIAKIAGIAKIENQEARPLSRHSFQISVMSENQWEESCRTGPLSRREQAARLDFRQKAVKTIAEASPCGLAHSVPPASLRTTTMPAAKMSGSQTAGNARFAAVQFGYDSTRRQWMGGGPAGVPSGPDEFAEEGTRSYMSQPAV